MPDLVLGPLLRYIDETQATVWVETDGPCEVEILGRRARTFHVEGHHYAIVPITDLEPGGTYEYEVSLDREKRSPEGPSEFPPSTIRTIDPDAPLELVFGSCRVAVPHHPPYTLKAEEDERGREIDALYALAVRMMRTSRDRWPEVLLQVGDQVYVDEGAPQTREFIRSRRDVSKPPGEGVADFEEYTRLYRESWGEPVIGWLLSNLPSLMIFDDHDVHDDWNISERWVEEMRAQPWWEERMVSGLMSYWIYQHLGNLSPTELQQNDLLRRVAAAEDAGPILRRFASESDHSGGGSRWSYIRDFGRSRLVAFDSREGRVLHGRTRKMIDDREWERIQRAATANELDHLLLIDTLPLLLPPGGHYLEAWNEAVCAGAWGRRFRDVGERIRRALDLEHWAAFGDSFHRLVGLISEVATGRRGSPPATIVTVGGDVHHAYLAEVAFKRGAGAQSAVYQAVCSPFRNALDSHERTAVRIGTSKPAIALLRALAHRAGVRDPEIRWRLVEEPTFDNQFATLELEGRRARFRIEKIVGGDWRNPGIETSLERELNQGSPGDDR